MAERPPLTRAEGLIARYLPYVGQTVTITSSGYTALDPKRQDRTNTGTVLGLARRETGHMTGVTIDMVLSTRTGALITINAGRIVSCRPADRAGVRL